jgi:hypothetical protein
MADRNLRFVLSGVDQSASSTLGKAAKSGEDASSKIGGAFQKLGGQIGGEFGEVLNKLGEGFEQTGEKGISLGKKFAIGGAAVAGVGALLTAAGSKEKQATDQLKASVDSTGESYSDYADKIEKVVKREENFAHSASDTKDALRTLTDATGSEQKALDNMQVVTDLAASKHISLADAAALLAKILEGKGGKTLLQYGIIMKTNADGTKDAAGAVDELGQKLKGQAAASMDNWGAKVEAAKVKVQDFIGEVGQKVGPVLTVAGTVIGVVSGGLDILAARAEKAAAKELLLAAAEEKAGASSAIAAAGSAEVAAGNEAVAASSTGAAAGLGRAAVGVVGLAAVAYGLGELIKGPIQQLTGETDGFGKAMEHSTSITETFQQALIASGGAVDKNVTGTAALSLQQTGLADKAAKAGISLADMTTGLTGTDAQFKSLVATWEKAGAPSDKTILNLIALRGEFQAGKISAKDYAEAVAGIVPPTADTSKEQAGLSDQINKVKSAELSATAITGYYNTALDKLSGTSINAEQQELALKDALDGAKDALKGNGSSLSENTAKGRANKEWLLTQISAVNEHSSSVLKQTGSVNKATAALGSDEAALRRAAVAAGLNKNEVDALIRKYAAVPSKVQTLVDAKTEAAQRKIRDLQYALDRLRGKVISIDVYQTTHQVGPAAGGHLAHASGGMLSEGWNTAGEGSATELMYKQGSQVRVLTAQQSKPMLGGGGNTYNIQVNLPGLYGGQDAGRAVAAILEKYVGGGGTVTMSKGIR